MGRLTAEVLAKSFWSSSVTTMSSGRSGVTQNPSFGPTEAQPAPAVTGAPMSTTRTPRTGSSSTATRTWFLSLPAAAYVTTPPVKESEPACATPAVPSATTAIAHETNFSASEELLDVVELVEALVDVCAIGALVPVDEVVDAVLHSERVVAGPTTAVVVVLPAD